MTSHDRHGLYQERSLSSEQLAAIHKLRDICNTYEGLDLKLYLDQRPTEEEVAFVLFYADGDLVGFCGIDRGIEIELCGMVHPAHRRTGIGRRLIEAATDQVKQPGIDQVLLICENASRSGQGFVAASGARYSFGEHRMELIEPQAPPPAGPQLSIAKAGPNDVRTLARLNATSFGGTDDLLALRIEYDLRDPQQQFYLAHLGHTPVGGLKVIREGSRAGIYAFGVLPEYRRRGIGRQFLSRVLELLQSEQYDRIYLEVETTNTPAIGLYRSCGFRETTTYGYYSLQL